jgi:hypothetical protein
MTKRITVDDCQALRASKLWIRPRIGNHATITLHFEPPRLESFAKKNQVVGGTWAGLPLRVGWFDNGSWVELGGVKFDVVWKRHLAFVKPTGSNCKVARDILVQPDGTICTRHSAGLKSGWAFLTGEKAKAHTKAGQFRRIYMESPSISWIMQNPGVAPDWIKRREGTGLWLKTINKIEGRLGLEKSTVLPGKERKRAFHGRHRNELGQFVSSFGSNKRLKSTRENGQMRIPEKIAKLFKAVTGSKNLISLKRTSQRNQLKHAINQSSTLRRSEKIALKEFFGIGVVQEAPRKVYKPAPGEHVEYDAFGCAIDPKYLT